MKRRVKILFIPSASRIAPATRYRVYSILPFLEREGIDYKIYSILSEETSAQMIKSPGFGRIQKIIYYTRVILEKFIRSFRAIFLAGKFDLVFLQRTTFWFGLERLLSIRNKNIIFDIDDPIYIPDTKGNRITSWIKTFIKKREVISILRVTRCVIAENNYIKDFVQQYCKKVYLITGPIDTAINYVKQDRSNSKEIVIGWIGSPSTTPYLRILDAVLRRLSKSYAIELRLIGANSCSIDSVKVKLLKWSEETEVAELHRFDIGVMPMPDNEWTRGKVGCKMLQYMANAIPEVVSYTPTTGEIIKNGVNGFLARTEEDWFNNLSLLIKRPELRQKIGIAGRKTVEENFSLDVSIPRYIDIFKNCFL